MSLPGALLGALAACEVPDGRAVTSTPEPALVFPSHASGGPAGASADVVSSAEGIRVRVDDACPGDVLYELAAGGAVVRQRAPSGAERGLRWPAPEERASLRYGCDDDSDGVVSSDALVTQPVAWRIDRARTLVLSLPRRDRLDALVLPASINPP
jgi:hypothetical protein